jgi:hypothetical protein
MMMIKILLFYIILYYFIEEIFIVLCNDLLFYPYKITINKIQNINCLRLLVIHVFIIILLILINKY